MDDRKARMVQREASEALLDRGVSLPLREFRLPFMRRALRLRVTMRRPRLEDQIRISRLYLSMDVSPGEMESFSVRERMEFMARHGVTLSRMVALTLCRGAFSRHLERPVAWFLRVWVDHRFLVGALEEFISLMGSQAFTSVIRSVDRANPMRPRLSQRRKGS